MSDEKAPYTYVEETDALGFAPRFTGPGISRHDRGVRPQQPMNEWASKHVDDAYSRDQAAQIARLLNVAFQAGREDMRAEFRRTLGIPERR
jgi:hypothetical protein